MRCQTLSDVNDSKVSAKFFMTMGKKMKIVNNYWLIDLHWSGI